MNVHIHGQFNTRFLRERGLLINDLTFCREINSYQNVSRCHIQSNTTLFTRCNLSKVQTDKDLRNSWVQIQRSVVTPEIRTVWVETSARLCW